MTLPNTGLRQLLRNRSQAIVDGWYKAVQDSAVALRSPSELRSYVSDIWDQVMVFLLLEEPSPRDAESIGASFVPLRIRPQAVGRISQVLLASVLDDLPDDVDQVLRARLPRLTAGLMTGFVRSSRQKLLRQQEEIREAYARTLRQAEDQLRIRDAGIEGSINAIMMLDLEGTVTYVNPAFLRMWGYQDDHQVFGRHVSDFGEWRGDVNRALGILSEQGGWSGELVAVRADDSCFEVYTSVSLVRDDAGRPTHLMCFFVDVTDRNRAQEALRRRARQAAFLNEIGEEIAKERTTQAVLERAVRLAHKTFDLQQVAVLLLDPERETLNIAAVASSVGEPAFEGFSVPLGKGITGWVAQQNRTAVVEDVHADPRYEQLISGTVIARSELAVPIRAGERVIGVLDAQSPALDAFGSGEQVVMETLADQIAVALENARLYQAVQDELAQRKEAERALWRSVQRLETVHEIDQAILGAKSKEDVAKALLQNIRQIVPCQRASIVLFDFEAHEMVVVAAVQTIGEGRASTGARFPITQQQLLSEMLGQHRVTYVRDLRQLPQSSPFIKTLCEEGIRSVLVGPITVQSELIGALSLGSRQLDGFALEQRPIVEELADTAGIAMQQARLFESVRQHRERLRRTMSRLAEAEEDERRRVVRELHDQVGQNLTALDLNLSLVRSQLEEHGVAQLAARLDDSLSLVGQTNRRIRQLMIDLRPPVLDDYGLLSALHWYGDRFSARTGIPVLVKGEEETADDLPPHVENALFRIAQEALNNIAKHACAADVTIALTSEETVLRLTISDNGLGFEIEAEEHGRDSWGLLTMRERAESVGARCCFESFPGKGTRVLVEMPALEPSDQPPPTP